MSLWHYLQRVLVSQPSFSFSSSFSSSISSSSSSSSSSSTPTSSDLLPLPHHEINLPPRLAPRSGSVAGFPRFATATTPSLLPLVRRCPPPRHAPVGSSRDCRKPSGPSGTSHPSSPSPPSRQISQIPRPWGPSAPQHEPVTRGKGKENNTLGSTSASTSASTRHSRKGQKIQSANPDSPHGKP